MGQSFNLMSGILGKEIASNIFKDVFSEFATDGSPVVYCEICEIILYEWITLDGDQNKNLFLKSLDVKYQIREISNSKVKLIDNKMYIHFDLCFYDYMITIYNSF